MWITSPPVQNWVFHPNTDSQFWSSMRIAFLKTDTKKGEVGYTDDGSVIFLKWKDFRNVKILSTFHKAERK
jgi:hypothetical protein